MGLFIAARLEKDHEIVGFFWARNWDAIWDAVNECCDPGACEYLTLPRAGGFFCPVPSELTFPPKPDQSLETAEDSAEFGKYFRAVMAALDFSETVQCVFDRNSKWTRFRDECPAEEQLGVRQ